MRGMSAVLLLLVFSANVARGGESPGATPVDPGSRVRIIAASISTRPLVGTLVESRPDGIVVSLPESGRRLIPRSEINRVERSEGRKRHALHLRSESPRPLFSFSELALSFGCAPNRCYAVSPDGERFYVRQVAPSTPQTPVTHIQLVQSWTEELTALVPSGAGR